MKFTFPFIQFSSKYFLSKLIPSNSLYLFTLLLPIVIFVYTFSLLLFTYLSNCSICSVGPVIVPESLKSSWKIIPTVLEAVAFVFIEMPARIYLLVENMTWEDIT